MKPYKCPTEFIRDTTNAFQLRNKSKFTIALKAKSNMEERKIKGNELKSSMTPNTANSWYQDRIIYALNKTNDYGTVIYARSFERLGVTQK